MAKILEHDAESNLSKSYLEYLVEDLKVTQLLPQYQVMTSKFEILHFSPFLDRTWLSLKRNSNLKDRVLQETEYELNGETVPFTVSSVEGRVRDIVLINVNLFGDHRVLLQSFDEKQDREEAVFADLVDALSVDQYDGDIIFVNNIPTKNHFFRMGQTVKYEGENAQICGMTENEICVQIRDGNVWSFCWIERDEVPLRLTLLFQEQNVMKYHFAVTASSTEKVSDLSSAKKYDFKNTDSFSIPYRVAAADQNGSGDIGIYAKSKEVDCPFARIKTIQIPSDKIKSELTLSDEAAVDINIAVHRLLDALKERDSAVGDPRTLLNGMGMGSEWASECISSITAHPLLFAVTAYRRKLVIERLMVELGLLSLEWIHWILEQKKEDKPLLKWLVEDRRVRALYPHYLATTSGFKLKYHSMLLGASWLEFDKNGAMDGVHGFGDDDDACFVGTEYEVNGVTVPMDESMFIHSVPHQNVRNITLFADRRVPVDTKGAVGWTAKTIKMELNVTRHRGHYQRDHPKNLLVEGTGNWYDSEGAGPPNGDWIIFN